MDALAAAVGGLGLDLAAAIAAARKDSALSCLVNLPGPTGERNSLQFAPRGKVACQAATTQALAEQLAAAFATGNRALLPANEAGRELAAKLGALVELDADVLAADVGAVLFSGSEAEAEAAQRALAARDGALVPLLRADAQGHYNLHRLVVERALSVNTTAAGGNASLMSIGD